MERKKILGLFGVLTAGFAYVILAIEVAGYFAPPPEKPTTITASVTP